MQDDEHESYGMIGWSRVSGGKTRLFGSALKDHDTTVILRIARGRRTHDLSRDWYHAGRELIEVQMSAAQFAEFLTSANTGTNIPCTLRRVGGQSVAPPPDEGVEVERVRDGFEAKLKDLGERMRKHTEVVADILSKPSITKADRERIRMSTRMLIQEVEANLPFVLDSFQEATQKVTQTAKAELDAFATHFIHAVGLEAIAQHKRQLTAAPQAALGDDEPVEFEPGLEAGMSPD